MDSITHKKCSKCGEMKSALRFSRDKSRPDGKRSTCKNCASVSRKAYYRKYKVQSAEYYKHHNLAKYGMSLDDYNRMLFEQNECCVICGRHRSDFKKALAVDHNHKSGKVRGLLCNNCNFLLGHSHDDPIILIKVATYLLERNYT